MRIAWFTPFGPRSAIGQYSDAITRRLVPDDEVVLFVSAARSVEEMQPSPLPRVLLSAENREAVLRRLDDFDLCVYNHGDHFGNHSAIFEIARDRPGVVILHDPLPLHFFNAYFLRHRRDPDAFCRQMADCHGPAGEEFLRAVLRGNFAQAGLDPDWLRYPLHRLVLRRCLGVVVHSDYARRCVTADSTTPVAKLEFPVFGAAQAFRQEPARRPAPDGQVRLLTFGVINRNKLVHAVIKAIGASPFLRAHARYLVVGDGDAEYLVELRRLIDQLDLHQAVRLVGYRPDEELREALAEADLVVNLRNPHFGESSASLLTALLAGRPVLVWGHGYYGEFPGSAVMQIHSEYELPAALGRLCRDRPLLLRMGAAAREHALQRFNTDTFCTCFRAFAEQVLARQALLTLADTAADVLAELGASPGDALVQRIGRELAALEGEPASPLHAFLQDQEQPLQEASPFLPLPPGPLGLKTA